MNKAMQFSRVVVPLVFVMALALGLRVEPLSRAGILLGSCPSVQGTPYMTIAYGTVSADGAAAAVGTVVEARSPRGDTVGCFEVTTEGHYGAMYVYGEDTSASPTIPGMRAEETVAFYVDGVEAAATPALTWSNDMTPHEVNLAALTPTPTPIVCNPATYVDRPAANELVGGLVVIQGWALDRNAVDNTGVNAVALYLDGPQGTGTFIGNATYGTTRSDIAAAFGAQFLLCGWFYEWDTAGITPGTHTLYVAAHNRCDWFYKTHPIVVTSCLSKSWIDQPQRGATVGGVYRVSGWAIELTSPSGTGVDSVKLYLDGKEGVGTFLATATYGQARADVGTLYGSQFTNSGWYADCDFNSVSKKAHTLYVAMHTSCGWFYRTLPFIVGPCWELGFVDQPGQGELVGGPTLIQGWALDRNATSGTGVNVVGVYLDGPRGTGTLLGYATYGTNRTDIAAVYGSQFQQCGYFFDWDTTGVPTGTHTLYLAAHSACTWFHKTRTLVVTTSRIKSWIDHPLKGETVSGTYRFSGWAINLSAPTGTGVDAVKLYLDGRMGSGVFLGDAVYGTERLDVGGLYGEQFTNCGWYLDWDTTGTTSKAHTLYLAMHTVDGWFYRTLPFIVAN